MVDLNSSSGAAMRHVGDRGVAQSPPGFLSPQVEAVDWYVYICTRYCTHMPKGCLIGTGATIQFGPQW